jgi:molybdate transport system substrate-binding protein
MDLNRRLALAAVVLALTVIAFDSAGPATTPAADATATPNVNAGVVRVAAALPLTTPFGATKAAFESDTPAARLVLTFGPTQALVGQVQVGGFDVLATEDLASAQNVVSNRHAAGPAQVFATDRLVLIVSAANPKGIHAPADLARAGVRIAGASAQSPLAVLTTQVVAQLGAQPGSPAGYAAAVAANTTAIGDDPRAVVSAVSGGTADAAFTYASDAMSSAAGLTQIALPAAVAPDAVARYAVVVLATAGDPVAASAFSEWLTTAKGEAALAAFGFEAPGS